MDEEYYVFNRGLPPDMPVQLAIELPITKSILIGSIVCLN